MLSIMFELSVAFKYLTPRWRQLSISLISVISVFVIALVIWLIVVFFSVTQGLEQTWIQRLIALTAPIRITPTEEYYRSYYYQIDSVTLEGGYTTKTLREKLLAAHADPYDPAEDGDIQSNLPAPDLYSDGSLKDLVKEAYQAAYGLKMFPGLKVHDFEMAAGSLRLNLIRETADHQQTRSALSQTTYLASIDPMNSGLPLARLPMTLKDLNHLFERIQTLPQGKKEALNRLFSFAAVSSFTLKNKQSTATDSIKAIRYDSTNPLEFVVQAPKEVGGGEKSLALRDLNLKDANPAYDLPFVSSELTPLWAYQTKQSDKVKALHLPEPSALGDPLLLPKGFREAGIYLGDQGILSYKTVTATALQEQQIPVYVAGFYDPGIIPIGGKLVLASEEIVSMIHSAQGESEALATNGFNVRFDNLEDVDKVKKSLLNAFERAGIAPYWRIETYREFEFTKDLIQQLRSERNLWTLLATVIILVACSNIVSMLIILVNDKKKEIGILRSIGASSVSIALIFGLSGMLIGMAGSLIGMAAAWATLQNLNVLIDWIGHLQGHEMFNPLFYGNVLPTEISGSALLFVVIATTLLSLISGIIPAIKAALVHPAASLRAGS